MFLELKKLWSDWFHSLNALSCLLVGHIFSLLVIPLRFVYTLLLLTLVIVFCIFPSFGNEVSTPTNRFNPMLLAKELIKLITMFVETIMHVTSCAFHWLITLAMAVMLLIVTPIAAVKLMITNR